LMARYVILEPPGRPSEAVAVRDGFSFLALALPVIWLLWHRLWFWALAVFGAAALFSSLAYGLGQPMIALAGELAIALIVALEGPQMRVAALEAQGWSVVGSHEAASLEDAELKHFYGGEESARVDAVAPAQSAKEQTLRGEAAAKGQTLRGEAAAREQTLRGEAAARAAFAFPFRT
jgi:Protein of unknown function (DUF2628)